MRVESILILALFFPPLLASMVMISSSSKKGNGRSTSEAEVKGAPEGAFPFRLFYEQDQRDLAKWKDAAVHPYSMGHNFQLDSSFSHTVCVRFPSPEKTMSVQTIIGESKSKKSEKVKIETIRVAAKKNSSESDQCVWPYQYVDEFLAPRFGNLNRSFQTSLSKCFVF